MREQKEQAYGLTGVSSAQDVFVFLAVKFPEYYSLHLRGGYDFPRVAAPGNKDKGIQLCPAALGVLRKAFKR